MPTATQKQTKLMRVKKGSITIEGFLKGWIQQNTNNNIAAPENPDPGYYTTGIAIDIFRQQYIGCLAPGVVFDPLTDTGGFVTDRPLDAIATSDGVNLFYAILADGSLCVFNTNQTLARYTVTSPVSVVNNSCILYKDSAGNEFVVSSWENSTQGDLAIIKSSGVSQTQTWFSGLTGAATLTKLVPHMIVLGGSGNSNIYITNGQYIASATALVGAVPPTGTGNSQALNLGPGWIAQSMCTYQNFLVIIGHKNANATYTKGQVRVWFWDYANPNPNSVFDVPDNNAGALFVDNLGDLYAFTNGRDNNGRIWKYNGANFEEKFYWLLGVSPTHGQVDSYGGDLCFRDGQGNFGVNRWDSDKNGFHNITSMAAAGTQLGFLRSLDLNGLYAGGKNGSTWQIQKINTSKYTLNAVAYTQIYFLPPKSRITGMKTVFAQFGTGASVTYSLYLNESGATDYLNQQLTNTALGVATEYFQPLSILGDSFAFKILFDHLTNTNTAAIIRRIIVEYEYPDYKS